MTEIMTVKIKIQEGRKLKDPYGIKRYKIQEVIKPGQVMSLYKY